METPQRTTAGVLFWTPAPAPGRRSPVSSVASEDEDEDDDFISQMDGSVTGLSEGLKNVELEARGDLCFYLAGGNVKSSLKARKLEEEEEVKQRKGERGAGCLPERERCLDIEEEEDGLEAGSVSEGRPELDVEPLAACSHRCPASGSPTRLLLSAGEGAAAAPGLEAETLPELSLVESLSGSHKSNASLQSSPRCPVFSEEVIGVKHHKQRTTRLHTPASTPSSSSLSAAPKPDREQRATGGSSEAAPVDESRKRPLRYATPDFSKVEPRVRFPKGGYEPPQSRGPSKRHFLSPEPRLVFTSPADIVKEVLLNVRDPPPATSDSNRPRSSSSDRAVPREFRRRQYAITLLEQLQEDYNTLLTKYADAENTIDRLRLEAKVNLYSDPPTPGHMTQQRLNSEASRFMMLDFPQAQRAESNTHGAHQGASSRFIPSFMQSSAAAAPDPRAVLQPDRILYDQADHFLQQLQTFEDLLQNEALRPVQQVKGVSQLAEELDSLENGYLLARDEQKLRQQREAGTNRFDPERELEALIFQFGLHMEDLKEQATCEAPLSAPSEGGETPTPPQNSTVPSLADPGEAAAVEVSSAGEEKDEMERSLHLTPMNGEHGGDEDLAALTDQNQRLLGSGPASRFSSSQSLPGDPKNNRRTFEVKPSQSSSLSSLGEATRPPGSGRGLSQEGIVSPEMDSGFVGSEGSRLHQMASESVLVPQKKNPGKPQAAPVSSSSRRHTAVKDDVGSSGSKRTRAMERSGSSSCSQHRAWQTERSRAGGGLSETMKSNGPETLSAGGQTDDCAESLGSSHSSSVSSFLDSPRHLHGDPLRALRSSRVAYRNNAIQTLQDEVTKLKTRLEHCLGKATPQTSVSSAQKNHPRSRTSAAHIGSGQRLRDVSRGRGVEEEPMRRAADERPPSPKPLILPSPETFVPQPPVSRCPQTSTAASDTHTHTVHRRAHGNSQRRSRRFASGAPPVLLRCTPVCVPPLLLYSFPPYVSPSDGTGVRGREETRRRSRRSASADNRRFADSSLDRAIRAARHMKLTSRRMARSLAAGLLHQDSRKQSCS
ncbi:microtubule organization protein AKNA [Brachionichthys hirsutus]|uniref:microtubule organization protein AKNA n=1 Tax=Brachionichthys hirsutus TaxID=412623 RepID=UPI0036051321